MMSVASDRFELVMLHLKHCYRTMRPLMDDALEREDVAPVVLLKERFRELRDELKDFARHQHGIDAREVQRHG